MKVTEHIESRLPELSEVRSQVECEYLAQNRMELQEKTYAKLRERYEVVLEVPKDLDYTPNTAVAATPMTGSTQ